MNEARLEMLDDVGTYVDGEMSVPQRSSNKPGEPDFNTLDEPIRETILRDVKAVGIKFAHVLFPKEKKTLLKEWDLWGPLVLCTFMAMILQGEHSTADSSHDGGPEFAQVFVIVWVGSMIVTLNSKLLGGNIIDEIGSKYVLFGGMKGKLYEKNCMKETRNPIQALEFCVEAGQSFMKSIGVMLSNMEKENMEND